MTANFVRLVFKKSARHVYFFTWIIDGLGDGILNHPELKRSFGQRIHWFRVNKRPIRVDMAFALRLHSLCIPLGGVGFFWGEGVLKCCEWKRGMVKITESGKGMPTVFL